MFIFNRHLYMKNLNKDFEKTKKIILSCINKDQLEIAYNYYKLFFQKYKNEWRNYTLIYYDGILTGILQSKIHQYDLSKSNSRQ